MAREAALLRHDAWRASHGDEEEYRGRAAALVRLRGLVPAIVAEDVGRITPTPTVRDEDDHRDEEWEEEIRWVHLISKMVLEERAAGDAELAAADGEDEDQP